MAAFILVAAAASVGFLLLSARWLRALRAAAIARHVTLSRSDVAVAAVPIGFAVVALVAAGLLLDAAERVLASAATAHTLPLVGTVDRGSAAFALLFLAVVALSSPFVSIALVERRFARRAPALVGLGRRAAFATLTGVDVEDIAEDAAPVERKD
jgi:hypothetical protein